MDRDRFDDLDRQRLWLLAQGATVAEVAGVEGYSARHMRRKLANLYRRLGADARVPALVAAARLGLLEDEASGEVRRGDGHGVDR